MSRPATSPLLLAVLCAIGILHAVPAEELRLPLGDAAAGRQAFIDLRCIHCHAVEATVIDHLELGKRLDLKLAGPNPRFVKSYPDLLTAITNPRHVIQEQYRQLLAPAQRAEVEPFMLDLTRTMTVRQLIDVSAFLDERYAANQPNYIPRR
jgi:hypothetical protein